jgi:hypothetical protein
MEKLNNIVVVTGVSASGKDFLLDKVLADITSTESAPYRRISFGAELHKLMNAKFPNRYTGPLGLRGAPEAENGQSSG